MAPRVADRLLHISDSIAYMHSIFAGKTLEHVEQDVVLVLALERLLEIVSEASRHIPEQLCVQYAPDIDWRSLASLGNILRHAYHRSDLPTLWRIYQNDVPHLDVAVMAMLRAPDVDEPTPPASSPS